MQARAAEASAAAMRTQLEDARSHFSHAESERQRLEVSVQLSELALADLQQAQQQAHTAVEEPTEVSPMTCFNKQW